MRGSKADFPWASSCRYPDLAGYSNYLENVLKNVSTGQTYYDGINEDYNFLTTSQANASCLTESATSYQVCTSQSAHMLGGASLCFDIMLRPGHLLQ